METGNVKTRKLSYKKTRTQQINKTAITRRNRKKSQIKVQATKSNSQKTNRQQGAEVVGTYTNGERRT